MLNLHSSMGKLSHPFNIGKFPARPPRSRLLCSSQGFSVTASSPCPLSQRFLCRRHFCFRAAVILALRNTTKTTSYVGQLILPSLTRKLYAPVKFEKDIKQIKFLQGTPSNSLSADVLWGSFVTHSFLPPRTSAKHSRNLRSCPWGRNECVTNEPQRTSAGRLTNQGIAFNLKKLTYVFKF